ncbi:PulF Type II secretory pathway, component PulF [Burkholderiaceae bacterium]
MLNSWTDAILLRSARHALRARRAEFYYDLASSLTDKVPLFSTLKDYEARARRRNRGDALMYLEMLQATEVGSLSDALIPIVSPTELILLDAIQRGGDAELAKGLFFLAETVQKIDMMQAAARKAVVYPVILLAVFSMILVGFALFAVPIVAQLFDPALWPFMGRVLYGVSQYLLHYGICTFLAFLSLATAFAYSLPRWQGPLRRRLDRFMPYGMYRVYTGSMLIVSLSVLLKSGVSLRSAIERAMKYSSPWLRWHLKEILRGLSDQSAAKFGTAFRTGLLTQMIEDRIEDAAKRRDPVTAFVKIGVGSIDKIVRNVEHASSKVNTTMLVMGGLILGGMMLGFMQTTMEIQSAIRPT